MSINYKIVSAVIRRIILSAPGTVNPTNTGGVFDNILQNSCYSGTVEGSAFNQLAARVRAVYRGTTVSLPVKIKGVEKLVCLAWNFSVVEGNHGGRFAGVLSVLSESGIVWSSHVEGNYEEVVFGRGGDKAFKVNSFKMNRPWLT